MTNETCDRAHVEDPANYVKYYCAKCTAHKRQGTTFCPFCGIMSHYHYHPISKSRVEGSGRVELHPLTADNETGGLKGQTDQGHYYVEKTGEIVGGVISSEEHQFNTALNTVRETFDKLKRSRKLRERAEKELKETVSTLRERDSQIHHLREDFSKVQRPDPPAIRNVYGQRPGSDLTEVLGILRIEQGRVCDITVRLPR